jgi:hypothetical protein
MTPTGPEPPLPKPPRVQSDPEFDDAALLLAGLPLSDGGVLASTAQSQAYANYQQSIQKAWVWYDQNTRSRIISWARRTLDDVEPGPVFYPFSGPDLLNPLALFPQAKSFTLLGLEPVGTIPRASQSSSSHLERLTKLKPALKHILRRNYFITDAMGEDLGERVSDVGVAAILMLFIARTGNEILGAREITLGPDGAVAEATTSADDDADADAEGADNSADADDAEGADDVTASATNKPDAGERVWPKELRGVEIRFRERGVDDGEEKVVRYFSANIDDEHFGAFQGLRKHLESLGSLITLTKAASYLMYSQDFDDVRSLILARSAVVVTESSGMPYHYLSEDSWNVSLYGDYAKPIPVYADFCQPDLEEALKKHSKGKLPFYFGYEYRSANQMIVARRKKGHPLIQPIYDETIARGERTRCEADQVVVTGHIHPARHR